MIIADASVVVDMFIGRGGVAGDELRERLIREEPVSAPHLLDAEVAQALRRLSMQREMTVNRATTSLRELAALPLTRYAHGWLLPRAFDLRSNVTVYDGLYLALAEALDAPLLTTDGALANVPGCRARVEVLPSTPPALGPR